MRRKSYTRKNGVHVKSACVPRASLKKKAGERIECPPGKIPRASYIRSFGVEALKGFIKHTKHGNVRVKPTAKNVFVPASCVQGPTRIGPLKRGDLQKFGYGYKEPEEIRRVALKRAAGEYGALSLYHKLDAVAKLSVGHPASSIFAADRDWVRAKYM